MDSEIVKLFWEWYFPYNNQEIYKDDIAKMAFVAGYNAAQQMRAPDVGESEQKCTTKKLCPVHNVWHAKAPRG